MSTDSKMSNSQSVKTFIEANDKYASQFGDELGGIPIPPRKKLIIVTCMDARVEPFRQIGLQVGDAHIIRNAGGVVKDAIRSIVISQRLLGTREIAVFHHEDCGMAKFTADQLRDMIRKEEPNNTDVAREAEAIEFFDFKDLAESVRTDCKYLKEHPLVLKGTTISGWIYDVATGKIKQIV